MSSPKLSAVPPSDAKPLQPAAWVYPALDAVLVLVAFVLAHYSRYELQLVRPLFEPNRSPFVPYLPYAAVYALLIVLHCQGAGLYKSRQWRSWWDELYGLGNGITNATVIVLGLFFALQPLVFSRLMLLFAAVFSLLLLGGARTIRRVIQANLRSKGIGVQRVLIVGAGDVGLAVLRTMIARRELGYQPIGYVDENAEKANADLGRVKGLGGLDNLAKTIREHFIDTVVIALALDQHQRVTQLVKTCREAGADVRLVPDVLQLSLRQVQVENLDGILLLGATSEAEFSERNRLIKRALDIIIIVLTAPVWGVLAALVALAIRLEGKGPILYEQKRIGLNGQPFNMIKFRSMIPDAEKMQAQLVKEYGEDPRHPKFKNDPRITAIGRIIRKTSMDELPNIINILRGQMSVVGPRPPTPDEVALYETWHMQRLQIMPGLTGLWQISGRNDVPFDEMCLLDIYYIENWSIKLDLQIMLLTVPRVLLRSGVK